MLLLTVLPVTSAPSEKAVTRPSPKPKDLVLAIVTARISKGEIEGKGLIANRSTKPIRIYPPIAGPTVEDRWTIPGPGKIIRSVPTATIAYNSYSTQVVMPKSKLSFEFSYPLPQIVGLKIPRASFQLRYDSTYAARLFKENGWKREPVGVMLTSKPLLVLVVDDRPVKLIR